MLASASATASGFVDIVKPAAAAATAGHKAVIDRGDDPPPPPRMIISIDAGEGGGPQPLIPSTPPTTVRTAALPTSPLFSGEPSANRKSRASSLALSSGSLPSLSSLSSSSSSASFGADGGGGGGLSAGPRRFSSSNSASLQAPSLSTIMQLANSDLVIVPETATNVAVAKSPGEFGADDGPGSASPGLSVPGSGQVSHSSTRRGSESSVHSVTISGHGQNVAVHIDSNSARVVDDEAASTTVSVSISHTMRDGREVIVSGALTVTPSKEAVAHSPPASAPVPALAEAHPPMLTISAPLPALSAPIMSTVVPVQPQPAPALSPFVHPSAPAHPFGANQEDTLDDAEDERRTLAAARRRFSVSGSSMRPPSPPRRSSITALPIGLRPPSPPARRPSIASIPDFRALSTSRQRSSSPASSLPSCSSSFSSPLVSVPPSVAVSSSTLASAADSDDGDEAASSAAARRRFSVDRIDTRSTRTLSSTMTKSAEAAATTDDDMELSAAGGDGKSAAEVALEKLEAKLALAHTSLSIDSDDREPPVSASIDTPTLASCETSQPNSAALDSCSAPSFDGATAPAVKKKPGFFRIKSKDSSAQAAAHRPNSTLKRQSSMPTATPISRAAFLASVSDESPTCADANGGGDGADRPHVSFSGLKRQSTLPGTSARNATLVDRVRTGPLKSILKKQSAYGKDAATAPVKEGVAMPLMRRQTTRRMQFADEVGMPLEERRMYVKTAKTEWWQMILCCFTPSSSLAADQWSETPVTPLAAHEAGPELDSVTMQSLMPEGR